MLVPLNKDEQLLEDIRRARRDLPGRLHLWWLGQSGFLVQWQGRHLLLDPYLSDSLTRKYAATDKPHVRMTELVVRPERLDFIDLVTSSHNHTDHLDGETLRPLLDANPRLTILVPAANREFAAERLGVAPQRLTPIDEGQTYEASWVTIRALPSAHEQLERDDLGRCRFLGYVLHLGPWTLYHSGDTVRYPGLAERLRPLGVDLAMLPINGRSAERRVPGNLTGPEAVELARDAGMRLVVPCHFEMFQFNTVSPDAFVAAARRAGQPNRVLRCGERWSSDALDEAPTP